MVKLGINQTLPKNIFFDNDVLRILTKNSLRFNPYKPLLPALLYRESGNLALPNMQIAEVLYPNTFKIKGSERYLTGMHP